jgi:mannosyltransferase
MLLAAMALILIAYVLRLYRLDAQSVWFDEGWSWYLARLPLAEMARVTAADRSPVLYYALLHGWIDLGGQSEFAMRYLSVCADMLTVALIFTLGRALGRGARLIWLATTLYAICPLAIWYAQETRMYALVAALGLASCYWLWHWLQAPGRTRALILSAVCMVLAVYSHYYVIFLLPAQGIAVLAGLWLRPQRRNAFKYTVRWAIAAVGVGLALAPWLAYASVGFAYDDGFVFPLNTIAGRLGEWIAAFAGGGLARPLPFGWPVWVALSGGAGLVSFGLARRWRAGAFLVLLIGGALFAATLAVRVMYPYRSVFHPRYLIYVAPLTCLLIGGIGWSRRLSAFVLRLAAVACIAALWVPALVALYTDPSVARDDVRAAMQHVVEALRPGDVVVMTRDNYAVRYYLQTRYPDQAASFIAAPEGLHGMLKSDAALVQELDRRRPARVRLFLWQDDVVDPQRLVESALWANGYEIGEIDFGQIRLPLYQLNGASVQPLAMQPVDATFGDGLQLSSYWMRSQGYAGDWFYVVLAWTARQKLPINDKVFVQVWDAQGQAVFQQDNLPLNDLLPMTSWAADETLRDAHAMVIPKSLPAGEYRVVTGVYDPAHPTERLPVQSNNYQVSNNALILGVMQVLKR